MVRPWESNNKVDKQLKSECSVIRATRKLCSLSRPEVRGDRVHHPLKFSVSSAVVVRGFLFLLVPKLPNEEKTAQQTKFFFKQKLVPPDQNQVLFIQIIPWSSFALVETCDGITASQLYTDQKPMELPNTQLAGSKELPLLFWFSRVFQKSCGEKRWNASGIQDKLAD